MKRCSELAAIAVKAAQDKTKKWYDKKSRQRELKEGDMCLILLPTGGEGKSLLSRYRGPYPVLKKLNQFNYEIGIGNRSTVLHINLLKQYHPKDDTKAEVIAVNAVLVADPCVDDFEHLPSVDDELTNEDSREGQFGTELSAQQRHQVNELLAEFESLFGSRPGCTQLIEHKITVNSDKPIAPKSYRIPERLREQVNEQIQKMLEDDVIEYSDLCYVNPIVCVRKPGTDDKGRPNMRICLDLRAINAITISDEQPSSDMRRIIEQCGAAKYRSSLDLVSAFNQVPLEEESRKYCSFRNDTSFWRYKRMCFGLKNASKTMQRLMNFVLRGAEKYCLTHVDDVIIFSDTWEDHLSHLRNVFERLKAAGLVINQNKCMFGRNRMKCLGYILEDGKILPDPDKVKGILNFPTPKTKKQVKSFNGIINFYRSHINQCATLMKPLTDLTKRNEPDKVRWTEEHEKAFNALKEALCREPVLIPPNPNKGYVLKSDASNVGLGSILSQMGDDGFLHPCGYASRALLKRETRYTTTEREFLGILFGLKYFEYYILNAPVKVITDHSALAWINKMANENHRLTRWALAIQKYDIEEVKYTPGKELGDVDGLSRAFT